MTDRESHWRAAVEEMTTRRASYTPERLAYYDRIADEVLAFLDVRGDVLDVGCGDGTMCAKLGARVTAYLGVDPGLRGSGPVGEIGAVTCGVAERLPSEDGVWDTVLFYSSLQHVLDPAKALAEARRVLKDGGRLALQVSVNDPNPLFMHHWSPEEVVALVEAAGFTVEATKLIEGRMVCVRGRKV